MKFAVCVAAVVSLSSLGFGQSEQFEDPYVIESDGVLQAIAWRTRGGHRILLDDTSVEGRRPVSFNLSLYGNDPFYAALLKTGPYVYTLKAQVIHFRTAQGGGTGLPAPGTPLYGAKTGFKASKITFGGGNVTLKEVRGVTITGDCDDNEPAKTVATQEMVTTVKRQKLWQCSNFRLTLNGMVIDSALSFEPIELGWAPGGDLDGDGAPDLMLTGDSVEFDVPRANAAPFYELLAQRRAGAVKGLTYRVEYLDDDGSTIMALTMPVTIEGVNPSNMFADPASPSNNIRVWAKIKKDLAVEMERRSGGF